MLPAFEILKKKKLNFVFILIDDMGWRDAGCYGSSFYETPNIDRLAREGMRFTDAYAAAPVCSPTRASILTGKYPARLKITNWIGGNPVGKLKPAAYLPFLPREEVTIAEALKEADYATGFFGKWHLGYQPFYPEYQGFDINIGGHEAGHPASYFYPYKSLENPYFDVPGLENGEPGEYLTDRLTDEAIRFMDQNKNKPFFLYLCHYAVHMPIQAKEMLIKKYKEKLSASGSKNAAYFVAEHNCQARIIQDNPVYAAMIQSVDESVGKIMEHLKKMKLEKNTAIIFMSDNGGLSTLPHADRSPTANTPLRAGKGWLYEGGIREPMIIKWPGVIKPNTVCSEPVISNDFYPTILQMARLPLRPEQHKDGVSILPLLLGKKKFKPRALYWHYPHYHGSGSRPSGAIRLGDYKLIQWFEDNSVELYNLNEDIGERIDLSKKMPEKTEQLRKMLEEWRYEVGALMPTENPDWVEESE
ncbi:MAG: sulfatase [Calditrichaeota bacterium]|nr:sulfatase [Calditrichota bacterium]